MLFIEKKKKLGHSSVGKIETKQLPADAVNDMSLVMTHSITHLCLSLILALFSVIESCSFACKLTSSTEILE